MNGQFISEPFLPTRRVKTCIVSCEAGDVISGLEEMGINVIQVKKSKSLSSIVSSHPDLQVLPLGGNRIALNEEQDEVMNELTILGFNVLQVNGYSDKYPYDCLLDHLIVDGLLFGNSRAVPEQLISLNMIKTVNVRQGYTKCSCILIDKDSVITDDESIGKEASKYLKNVVVMTQDEVLLEGYDHGFIGGTCGKIDSQTFCFAGKIPDSVFGDLLRATLKEHGMRYLELGEGALRDIGGIIPILT